MLDLVKYYPVFLVWTLHSYQLINEMLYFDEKEQQSFVLALTDFIASQPNLQIFDLRFGFTGNRIALIGNQN